MAPATCWLLLALAAEPNPWHLCGPGGGGWIQSIAYSPHDPNTVYVGCDVGGFYRSTDRGEHWRIFNRGLQDAWVEAIVPHPTDPQVLFVATLSGVHRSDDGGETWRLLRNGFPELQRYAYSSPIGALAIDPREPDVLYAGVGDPRSHKGGRGQVYRTADGGVTWTLQTAKGALPDDALVSDILIRPDDSLLIATQHGLYRSTDQGRTWTPRNDGLANTHTRRLASSPARPAVVYCTVESTSGQAPWDGGVYRSDDGGGHWQRIVNGLTDYLRQGDGNLYLTSQYDRLVVDPTDADTVYVGGRAWVNASVFKTTDGGGTWRKVLLRGGNDGGENADMGYITFWGPSVECLAISPLEPQRLVLGTSGHVLETADGAASWHPLYTHNLGDDTWTGNGLEVTCLWKVACHPSRPGNWFLGYMDIGLWQTTDAGASVFRCMTGVDRGHGNCGMAFAFDPDDADHLWGAFGEWGSNRGGLYDSHDGGRSWAGIEGLPDAQVRSIVVGPKTAAGRELTVLQNGQGVRRRAAGASEWMPWDDGLPRNNLVLVQALPNDPTTLIGLLDSTNDEPGAIYRRSATDPAWQRLDTEPFLGYPRDLAVAPTDPSRIYLAARERYLAKRMYQGGCNASTDGGRTWTRVFENHFIEAVAVSPADPNTVVIGGTDHPYHDDAIGCGVHLSRDGGRTWVDLNEGLSITNVTEIVFDPLDPARIIVGTGGNSFSWRYLPQ